MRVADQYKGSGLLVVSGINHPVKYDITVWQGPESHKADGFLDGAFDALEEALVRDDVTLQLQTGEIVDVAVTKLDLASEIPVAEFAVNSPLPGF